MAVKKKRGRPPGKRLKVIHTTVEPDVLEVLQRQRPGVPTSVLIRDAMQQAAQKERK